LSNEKPNLLNPSYFELAFETGQQPPGKRLKAWRKIQFNSAENSTDSTNKHVHLGMRGRCSNFIRFCLNGWIYRNRTCERCGALMPGDISAPLSTASGLRISYLE
jgi:hypothetical protein